MEQEDSVLRLKKLRSLKSLDRFQQEILKARPVDMLQVGICTDTGCRACDSLKVYEAFKREVAKERLRKVEIKATGCHGFCEKGALVVIHPLDILYTQVKPEDVPEIVAKTLKKQRIVERLLYLDPETGKRIELESEVPYYKKQMRLILGNNSKMDPSDIRDYIALDGYGALREVLERGRPREVIRTITKSGLRGRGGGGFPKGVKWQTARSERGSRRFVICNADEGDPGAFMDRSICEGNPHSVLEGMIIGAYAVGAHEGFVYVRNEYPLAVEALGTALAQARECGLLGENILGTGFSFDVSILRGGGAFVCGESTALMASLEGKPGEPRAKYIHTVEKGLWEMPTVLNNVETWANVPRIILGGADWYTGIGTGDVSASPWGGSKGTKIFSLVGKIRNTGLVEVPMGTTLREIVFGIGGGVPEGKKFKAVQTGGPSGGCLGEAQLDLPVDFDALTEVGSMMGSGGMIVMDEDTCMVDVARYFIDFLKDESCGKCLPCREGLRALLEILNRITEGKGKRGDIELLEEISEGIASTSLCALGGSAPNPVLTTIRYFRDEYVAHIRGHRCPAGVCKPLLRFSVVEDKCTGCHACFKVCPASCITGRAKETHTIDAAKCVKCGACFDVCRFGAVER
ncbi:MAG: NADH-ubiquinone oxidoreductase-F iron-sulfur binding region domain-containing protein [Candidatus Krumholzibacteria bacterium]|nr:NADH-ubiquinone oxidoreductase-F iron-sulfur binding region domain-containing protein [Candidatus Krumholzibacteria bacterium]